jgi:hypothetical protein
MKLKLIFGAILGFLLLLSALLTILGIWGVISFGEVWKYLLTFGVVGLTVLGTSYVSETFFKKDQS